MSQLRTELKERDEEVGALATANKHLQQKVETADATIEDLQVRSCLQQF